MWYIIILTEVVWPFKHVFDGCGCDFWTRSRIESIDLMWADELD